MTPNDAAITASPKAAAAVAAYTSATGIAAWFDLIHGALAVVSLVIGIVVSFVLIRAQLQRMRLDREVHAMEQKRVAHEIDRIKEETRILRDERHAHNRQH